MFARNVAVRLRPNTLTEFNQILEKQVMPIMRKQAGFRDELTLAAESGNFVNAISLWDSKEQADAYDKNVYPQVLKSLEKVLDGAPKVHVSNVITSTSHKLSVTIAA